MSRAPNPVFRVAYFDVFRALGTWRWLVVPPVFVLGGWYGADHAEYSADLLARLGQNTVLMEPNFWDGALLLPTNKIALVIPFLLGFLLVTGDLYVRNLSGGTASLTVLRSRSRAAWWTSKVVSLAPPALLYSVLAFSCALVGSAFRLPVSFESSRAASIPWGTDGALYPRFDWMPMPLFFTFVVLYTAIGLWVLASLALSASVLYPRAVVPLLAALALVVVGFQLEEPFFYDPHDVPLNPIYYLTYVGHFGAGESFDVTPWLRAAAVLGGTLLFALSVGALRLRWTDF